MTGGRGTDDSSPWSSRPIDPWRMNSGELSANLAAAHRSLEGYRKVLDEAFDKIRALEGSIMDQGEKIAGLLTITSAFRELHLGCSAHPDSSPEGIDPGAPCARCSSLRQIAVVLDRVFENCYWPAQPQAGPWESR